MGAMLCSAYAGKLDCGLIAILKKYVQDAAGGEGIIVFCMAGEQHCEGKALSNIF